MFIVLLGCYAAQVTDPILSPFMLLITLEGYHLAYPNSAISLTQKREKGESSLRTDPHKSDKRHKLDKCQPFQKGPRYERYIPLIENRAIILEQDFNVEVPIQLPPIPPSRPSLDRTKYCRYHHNHGHNIKDCWALKDKIEELIQAGYLAQFVEKPNKNKTRG
ncbi:hypothetical protein JHK87_024887 [Glycine soja]|nr:hypothetical protein JHK87_024887 [Glycine soja]